MQNLCLRRIAVDIGHQTFGKARPHSHKQVAAPHRITGISRRVHTDDTGTKYMVARESADTHCRQSDRRLEPLGEYTELLRRARADDAAAAAEKGTLRRSKHGRRIPQSRGIRCRFERCTA